MIPCRIQRKRTKGWRIPESTVCIGRGNEFGNPFAVRPDQEPGKRLNQSYIAVQTVEDAVECYRLMCAERGEEWLAHIRAELRGKNLACWCPLDQPCHADVLLEIANTGKAT